jgi:phytol kinase
MQNNIIALILTFLIALIWLRLNDWIAHRGWVDNYLSRKIIHIGTGPLFVLCWLLFGDHPAARYLAALVPLLITGQFVLVGLGVIKDEATVQAMTRTGNPREILRGPVFYGIAFVLLTILYWKYSPIGMTALMLMAGGDGLADVVGRRWGKRKIPWSLEKTWVGSLGMFFGGWVFAAGILLVYRTLGVFPGPYTRFLLPLTGITALATLVESLPVRDVDNLTVTAAAVLLGHLWL